MLTRRSAETIREIARLLDEYGLNRDDTDISPLELLAIKLVQEHHLPKTRPSPVAGDSFILYGLSRILQNRGIHGSRRQATELVNHRFFFGDDQLKQETLRKRIERAISSYEDTAAFTESDFDPMYGLSREEWNAACDPQLLRHCTTLSMQTLSLLFSDKKLLPGFIKMVETAYSKAYPNDKFTSLHIQ